MEKEKDGKAVPLVRKVSPQTQLLLRKYKRAILFYIKFTTTATKKFVRVIDME